MKKVLLTISMIGCFTYLYSQVTVSGKVISMDDDFGIPGVNVVEKGTTNGTVTDIDGNYVLSASGSEAVLVFSFVGYTTQEIQIGDQSVIDVSLSVDVETLSEVVVIGYGSQKKKLSTGSISKVTTKNIEGYKVSDVTSALDGQVSGVLVSESSGQPGSGKAILIRGISTNGDNTPLYVVDGLTVGSIDNISPNDIESIDVLKDAASTAIYGSRAANGVIIITTKKGSEGATELNYEGFTSISTPWKVPEMLNAREYIEITREKFANGNQTASLDALGFPNVGDPTPDTDWMNVIFDNSTIKNHRISATLGNSYLSLEYWDQNGVLGGNKSNYKRYSTRFNSSKKLNEWVTVGQNVYVNRVDNQNIGTNNAFGTMVADAFAYDPLTEIYNPDKEYGFEQSQWVQKEYINPLSRLFLSNGSGHGDAVLGNVYVEVEPIEGLTVRSDLGVDYWWFKFRNFTPDYFYHSSFFNVNNGVSQGAGFGQNIQFENYAKYEKSFGDHSFDFVVGTTYIEREFEQSGGSTLNIPDAAKFNENFQYIDAGQDTSDLAFGGAAELSALISYYGRIIYDYQDKYLFSATLRRDGSTQFGQNKRFGLFPSASFGWVISDESFFNGGPISFLKLRASWGVNGSDRIGSLGFASTVVSAFTYPLGQNPVLNTGSTLPTLPNPNLKWEESVQTDIGVEVNLWDDMFTAEIDFYRKSTKDLLGREVIPGYLGVTDQPLSNLGEIRNTGIEAAVSYRISIGDLDLRANLNYSTFKNEVIEVPGSSEFINGWGWPVRNTAITRMTEGKPVGHFVGYKTLGIFQSQADVFSHINSDGDPLQPNASPGDLIFADVNGRDADGNLTGQPDGIINNDDLTDIGSPWPDHIIGLQLGAEYKGIDLKILFSTQIGHDIYRTYERSDITFTNYQKFWKNRWTESNPSNEYPRLVSNDPNVNQRPSDFYVEDGSFLRLRNLQIGYNVPVSVLEYAKLKALRIYVSANNLLTLTNYNGFDPEIGTNGWILDTGIDKGYYPASRTFGAGINIKM